jgi:hypothetical protein
MKPKTIPFGILFAITSVVEFQSDDELPAYLPARNAVLLTEFS